MLIAVCIKQVPDIAAVEINPATNTLDRAGAGAEMNPLDLYAIEAAVRLGDMLAARTIAFSMGPTQAEAVLRQALGQGIQSAAHLCDRLFSGADTWATAKVLTAAIRESGAELVICGQQATDGDTGQVGAELAAQLGWAHISGIDYFTHVAQDRLILERRLESGRQALQIHFPAVLSVLKPLCEPRLPGLADKIRAREAQIELWDAQRLHLPADEVGFSGSPTRVKHIFTPAARAKVRMIEAETFSEQIARLAESIQQSLSTEQNA